LRDTLKSQSIRDPLTGLFNRRFLEEALDRECRRAVRGDRPLSLVIFDVDHFKRFNDSFGHEAGDLVLKELGNLVQGMFREEDVACRFGGEEFALVLTDTTLDQAIQRAEELRAGAYEIVLTDGQQNIGRITLSLGVATLPQHGATGGVLLRAADKALYAAKNGGRDRVAVADPIPVKAERPALRRIV
jgi:diguanylate cyclase (GGDEF)-like protein